jgi:CUG-BP- and ETR3-like factor
LFIFHLPNEWSDFDLYYFFEQFKLGTIVSVRIMTDKTSGRSKGYGFVSYDNAASAEKAINKINGK